MATVRFEVGEAEQVRRSRIMGGSGLQGIDGLGLSSSGSSTSRRRRLWFGLASASKFLRRGRRHCPRHAWLRILGGAHPRSSSGSVFLSSSSPFFFLLLHERPLGGYHGRRDLRLPPAFGFDSSSSPFTSSSGSRQQQRITPTGLRDRGWWRIGGKFPKGRIGQGGWRSGIYRVAT
jgi:hypothetical protein